MITGKANGYGTQIQQVTVFKTPGSSQQTIDFLLQGNSLFKPKNPLWNNCLSHVS